MGAGSLSSGPCGEPGWAVVACTAPGKPRGEAAKENRADLQNHLPISVRCPTTVVVAIRRFAGCCWQIHLFA